jgi:hypothetical protein
MPPEEKRGVSIDIVPPAKPGEESCVAISTDGVELMRLPPPIAGQMGSLLIQLAAVAIERDRVGTIVGPPPQKLITLA